MANLFDPVLVNISIRAAEANPAQPGDYIGENGFLYCGKCHTAKECVTNEPILGGFPKLPCNCRCQSERLKADELKRKAKAYHDAAFDEPEMKHWNLTEYDDGLNPQLSGAILKYIENFDTFREKGMGLLIWGETTGNGKSYYAATIVNELCKRAIRCRMTTFGHILDDLHPSRDVCRDDYIKHLVDHEFLVLDDLGAQRDTSFANEVVFEIINRRCTMKRPTVFTTNYSIERIKNPQTEDEQRVFSRILEITHPLHNTAPDRRRKTAAEQYERNKNILGM